MLETAAEGIWWSKARKYEMLAKNNMFELFHDQISDIPALDGALPKRNRLSIEPQRHVGMVIPLGSKSNFTNLDMFGLSPAHMVLYSSSEISRTISWGS